MSEKIDFNVRRIIRYLFIFIIYNFIIASIAYGADYINDTFFQYSMANWDFISYWLFLSVCVLIAGFMLYMAPFFERWLNHVLEKKIEKLAEKK